MIEQGRGQMFLGCHVSIRNGYLEAAKSARKLGATAFQYFPKNPRSLAVKQVDRRDAEACKTFCRQHSLLSIAHVPYPTKLAVDDEETYRITVESVRNDLEIAEACGSIGVVVHFAQYKGKEKDPLYGYRRMIRMVNEVLSTWHGHALLLIENNAGQGSRMGTTLEELTQVRSLLAAPEKVGFCFDTCHAYASGLWSGNNWAELANHARQSGYLAHVKAVHLNDSHFPHRSCRDRHASIGRGSIPEQGFKELLATPEFRQLPLILETPLPPGKTRQEELRLVKERFFATGSLC